MAGKRESRLELAAKFQKWADEAHRWDAARPGLREDHLKLAIGWLALAEEIANPPRPNPGGLSS